MSEEKALAAFDSSRPAELLRDKVRIAAVEMMPAKEWEKKIKAEIDKFFSPHPRTDAYGNHRGTNPSEFSTLTQEVLKELMKEDETFRAAMRTAITEELGAQIDARLPDIFQDMVKEIIRGAMISVSQNMLYEIQNKISQNQY